ncbi:hypothetical protein CF64_33230 [Bradyrhizobium japonicum]|nr:hypothetical protein CF64_33230 [Bradyrhizobium japonicum]
MRTVKTSWPLTVAKERQIGRLRSFKEIAVIGAAGQFARFQINKGPDRLADAKWDDLYSDPEVARLAERFQPVELLKTADINAINFAEDPMSTTGLIEHHRRKPWPGNDKGKRLDRLIHAQRKRPIQTARMKGRPLFNVPNTKTCGMRR